MIFQPITSFVHRTFPRIGLVAAALASLSAAAQTTNNIAGQIDGSLSRQLPDMGASALRVLGALAVVLAVFLGGVWLFRNWQRLTIQRGRAPKLNVIETRSLGGRHALYVVGYEQERFLIAASPAGVSLLSHLHPADDAAPGAPTGTPAPASFAQALTDKLKGQ